jgi:predicted dehydrogenase
MKDKKVTRREFVADAGKIGLGVMIVPRHVLGGVGFQAPSDTMNFAVIGFGGMGSENALELAKTENLVAFADVDFGYSESKVAEKLKDNEKKDRPEGITLKQKFDKATRYSDFREMLDKQKDIDGIVIATPDHLHAVAAKAAMQRGKHVYVQKVLTYSVHEARVLRDMALANPKIVTQMGNQGHSSEGARLINEWIQAGIIGPVREVHVWTNRPVVYWPQGVPRPAGGPPPPAPPSPFGNPYSFRYVNQLLASAL